MSEEPSLASEFSTYCYHYANAINYLSDGCTKPRGRASTEAQQERETVKENLKQAYRYFRTIEVDLDMQKNDYERFFKPSSATDEAVVRFFRILSYVGVTVGAEVEAEIWENAQEFQRVVRELKNAGQNEGVVAHREIFDIWEQLRKRLVAILRATATAKGDPTHQSWNEIEDSDILNIPRYFVDTSNAEAIGVQPSFAGSSARSHSSDIIFTLTVPG